MLSSKNSHIRDKDIKFYEQGHIYNVKGDTTFTSVTTWVKKKFKKFDSDLIIDKMMNSSKWENSIYYGKTKKEIKDIWKQNGIIASNAGTYMHKMIEDYYNNIDMDESVIGTFEYNSFLDYLQHNKHLVPYRTEWMVYDERKKISGSIDMIYINEDGTISIYDWKRCKKMDKVNAFNEYSIDKDYEDIPDTNYWHYALQLNMYKHIIEDNYGFKVKELKLVVIHPEFNNTYKIVDVPFINKTF